MNVSKGLFVVLVISVISALMLASAVLAAPPTISVSGVPSNVVAGSSFKVTVTASNTTAGQTISFITLANSLNWPVSPQNVVACTAGSQSCVADFTVSVPLSATVGQSSIVTTQASANTGEVATDTKTVAVSGAPSTGNKAPVRIDAVEIDNFELSPSETNVRDLQRGEEFSLKVKLTALDNAKDIEVRAFVTGFEFSKTEPISDTASPFDAEKGVSYVKTLKLKLPDRAQEDKYRIHVVIAGRDNEPVTEDFRIKITPTGHEVVIKDLSVNPEDTVQAGRAVLATVRVKNLGDSIERDVKIRVSIPELGVTATPDFVDKLEPEESDTSEEFFLRIDQCAKPGTYDVKAEVTFEEGDKTVTAKEQIIVTKGPCEAAAPQPSAVTTNGVKIAYSPEPQDVQAGGAAVAYTVTVINEGATAKSYSLSVSAADWATVKLSPGNMVTVKGGDSQTVFVFVSAKPGIAAGPQTFILRLKDQAGEVVKDLSLSANVVGAAAAPAVGIGVASLAQLLQLGLIALIVVLVIVGLVLAFRRMKGPGEGGEGAQTYY